MTSNTDIKARAKDPKETRAEHGAPSEVTWDGGHGRQPYANRKGAEDAPGWPEREEGDRGELSGNEQEQLDRVKGVPEGGEPTGRR